MSSRTAGPAQFDDDASAPFGDELTSVCKAPLPTGYCIETTGSTQSSVNGRSSGTGAALTNYNPNEGSLNRVMLSFTSNGSLGSGPLSFLTIATTGEELAPGMYESAVSGRTLTIDTPVQLSVMTSGGCFDQLGRFRIDEMATDAQAKLSRLSLVFETRCTTAGHEAEVTRGEVHFQANGTPDPVRSFEKSIALEGEIFSIAYARGKHRVYGLDASARKITRVDLTSGEKRSVDVVQVPDAACADETRSRLIVVNKGSSIVSEYGLDDLKLAREYSWSGVDANPAGSHFQVHCAGDKLYLVDAADKPGLSVVESLAADPPKLSDQSAKVSGVRALVLKADFSELYTWQDTDDFASVGPIHRYAASDLSELDHTPTQSNDPLRLGGLTSALLLDDKHDLLIVKTTLFDAKELSKRIYTLPDFGQSVNSFREFAYAVDSERGLVATRRNVYELEHYEVVSRTATAAADRMFFDRDGRLWFFDGKRRALRAQAVARP